MVRRVNYRKIWEKHYGTQIPEGYEIHHKDGDHENNSPDNLILMSFEEHLNIHRQQGDWGAVQAMLMRAPQREGLCEAASKAAKQRVEEGIHNFQLMDPERRREISSMTGKATRDACVGIHAINADPLKAKENGRRGGLKAKEKNAGFLNTQSPKHGSKAVKGTRWWVNVNGERKRSANCPGEGWTNGTKKKEK